MSSQNLTTYIEVCFFICKDEEDIENVSVEVQLYHKDGMIVVKAKKIIKSGSRGLWATQADTNWYVYAWLAADSITTLFKSTLTAFKSKSLVRMVSYLKWFSWFYPSAIFFLQQFMKIV